jgi:hypothetical protein
MHGDVQRFLYFVTWFHDPDTVTHDIRYELAKSHPVQTHGDGEQQQTRWKLI